MTTDPLPRYQLWQIAEMFQHWQGGTHDEFYKVADAAAREQALRAELEQVITLWRDRAGECGAIYASGIIECADELDAVLGRVRSHERGVAVAGPTGEP